MHQVATANSLQYSMVNGHIVLHTQYVYAIIFHALLCLSSKGQSMFIHVLYIRDSEFKEIQVIIEFPTNVCSSEQEFRSQIKLTFSACQAENLYSSIPHAYQVLLFTGSVGQISQFSSTKETKLQIKLSSNTTKACIEEHMATSNQKSNQIVESSVFIELTN